MPKITRYNGKLQAFASEALPDERTIFGSEAQSNDLTAQINAEYKRGWGIIGRNEVPPAQDFNAIMYAATQLLAYLHQMGVAEHNNAQDYYVGSVVIKDGRLYQSKVNAPSNDINSSDWDLVPLKSELGAVAFSNDFNDLDNAPDFNDIPQVLPFDDYSELPQPGDPTKTYLTLDDGSLYYWDGTTYKVFTNQTALWGGIGGTLENQADLKAALDAKQDAASAFDGQYASLAGLPTLFDGQYASLAGLPTLFDGQYASLMGLPTLGSAASLDVDTDVGLVLDSDTKVPSQKAVKAYVDANAGATYTAGDNIKIVGNAISVTGYATEADALDDAKEGVIINPKTLHYVLQNITKISG